MTTPDIYADIEGLRQCSDRLNAVSDTVQLGVDGVRHMSSQPEIYGKLCGPMIEPIVGWFEERANEVLAGARDMTRRLAQGVSEAATGYEETDREIAAKIRQIRGDK
ncbi:MAG TPA: type VII secretion target [Candidatus Limnocylindrales bacterium]